MKLFTRSVVGLWSCDIMLCDFSHTLFVLHAMFRMRMGHYIGIPISSQGEGGYLRCSFSCNFIVRICPFARFAEMISQGYCSAVQSSWLVRRSVRCSRRLCNNDLRYLDMLEREYVRAVKYTPRLNIFFTTQTIWRIREYRLEVYEILNENILIAIFVISDKNKSIKLYW